MKKYTQIGFYASVLALLTSCDAVTGIFKAGFNVGVFVAVALVAVIIFAIVKMFSGKK